ncbi:MAG: hypothetical protein HOI88_01135 [Phycisphaerae bacterium]|jgi:hypothetical protein|nr:hypothetical protein [Phycisphaerae bacterium]MBT6268940.1 hypothetical protein [Phycisphaerae bacterium]MBT6283018.1 hypothetical protein [Phycisphaerae bacterium]
MTEEKPNEDTNLQETKELETKNEGVPHFVTPLRPIVLQVGEHVISALEEEDTVAVLTTITGSAIGQQVISIPLKAEHVQQVHQLIEQIHESKEPERVPCVGFHCLIDEEMDKEPKE